jgi:hypothetical protein
MRAGLIACVVLLCANMASAQRLPGVVDLAGARVNPFPLQVSEDAPPGRMATTVLIFVTTDCPISNRYAPEIKRLAEKYSAGALGVVARFWLVFPVPADHKDPRVIQAHLAKYDYGVRAIRDTRQSLVKMTGVTVTPEVAVIDPKDRLVYRGRIDDRYVDLGVERPVATTHDLEDVLHDVIAGKMMEEKAVTLRTTPAVGCYLPDLIK